MLAFWRVLGAVVHEKTAPLSGSNARPSSPPHSIWGAKESHHVLSFWRLSSRSPYLSLSNQTHRPRATEGNLPIPPLPLLPILTSASARAAVPRARCASPRTHAHTARAPLSHVRHLTFFVADFGHGASAPKRSVTRTHTNTAETSTRGGGFDRRHGAQAPSRRKEARAAGRAVISTNPLAPPSHRAGFAPPGRHA